MDLIALPENAIDYPYEDDPYFGETSARLAREQQAAVLVGAFLRTRDGGRAREEAAAADVATRVNVEGTRQVLAFAEAAPNLRRMHYVSTCYVSGRHPGAAQ